MRRFLNHKGMGLVESLIAVGIVAMASLASTMLVTTMQKAKRGSDSSSMISRYRLNMMAALRSSDALAKMADANGIPCFKTRQNCSTASTPFSPFSLVDPANRYLTRAAGTNFGFDERGEECVSFPSRACPFRYETQWASLCSGITCQSPQFRVKADLKVAPDYDIPLNPEPYSFDITLGQILGGYEQSCTSVGGTYIPGEPPRCRIPIDQDCPPAPDGSPQFVAGYDRATRTVTCKSLFAWFASLGSCPAGQVLIGTDVNGALVCRPRQIPTTPITPPFVCQVDPTRPECNIFTPPPGFEGGGSDGGCGGGGDGCF